MFYGKKPMLPKDGQKLVVGIVARISGCANQKEMSLEDQVDHGKEAAREIHEGPCEFIVIQTKGKGERLDRPELEKIEALLRSGKLDLLIVEDVGSLVRGSEASRLAGVAVDHGTRFLAPNDAIDTCDPSWEQDILNACADHVGHNAHTSKRLKHKLMNRFLKFGGATALPIFGYIVPDDAATYGDWKADCEATPIFQGMFERLFDGQSYGAIADWLNSLGIPTGPYARRDTWDGKMTCRVMANPILCGKPQRGNKHTVKLHETGQRVSQKSIDGPRYFDAPHLAHVSIEVFERAKGLALDRAAIYARDKVNGKDPLTNVRRKDSRFPGHCARCWYCGRQYVWGGNGITGNLQCTGSREWHCWNSIAISGELTAKAVMKAISEQIHSLAGFADQFAEMVRNAQRDQGNGRDAQLKKLAEHERSLAREKANVQAAIREFGASDMVKKMHEDVTSRERQLQFQRRQLEQLPEDLARIPTNPIELRELFENRFKALAISSADFAHQMCKLITRFDVYLVRLADGGHLFPRARVGLSLDGISPALSQVPGVSEMLRHEVTLNLFEPPQRERIRPAVIELRGRGYTQERIAEMLPEKPTITAVQNAAALHRQMLAAELQTPYMLIEQVPEDYSKLRRHKHLRYRFEPLAEYVRRSIT